jgi:hypothetical protein
MVRHMTVLGLIVAVVCGLAGCSNKPTKPPEKDPDPKLPVLERVEVLTKTPPPAWVNTPNKYKDAEKDKMYFVGVSFGRQTRQFAFRSAEQNAYGQIARYISQVVADKWQAAGEAKNLHGMQSIETVVEQFVQKSIAIAGVRGAELVDRHIERVSQQHDGTQVIADRVYSLYAVPKSVLANTGKMSAKQAAEAIQQERDTVRKQQLQKLESTLDNLSTEDFAM